MKKLLIVIAAVAAAAILFGCAVSKSDPAPEQGGNGTLYAEELEKSAEDGNTGAESIASFLKKDSAALAKISQTSECGKDPYAFLNGVILGEYSVSPAQGDESDGFDFRFTVSQSDNDILRPGDYHYTVSGAVWSTAGKNYDESYDSLIDILESAAQFGCIAWENGAPTERTDWFDYGVFQTVLKLSEGSPYVSEDGYIKEDYLRTAAYELFGIADFTPEAKIVYVGEDASDIFEYRDGAWGIAVQNIWAVPMSEIKAVREDGGKIEVDVQYYADTLRLIPAQKVCVYVTRTDNEFEYFLEKAVASDDTGCGIYYLSR